MLAKKKRSRIPSYFQQRPSGFYFRFALPIAYRPLLGCRELVRAIHASSRQEALHKANIAAYRLRCLFKKGPMDTAKLHQMIDTYLRESLARLYWIWGAILR
jgi:hypothetical protein